MKTKLMTIIAMCIMVTATAFAQTTHKIEKGETIESIAQKYGVTVDDIQKANPNAGGYFFAGMSIKIPAKPMKTETMEEVAEPVVTNVSNSATTFEPNTSKDILKSSNETFNDGGYFPKWNALFEIGYGFGDAPALRFTAGATYSITKPLYVGTQIGYSCTFYDDVSSGVTIDTDMNFIKVPLEIGYRITTANEKWGVAPFAGLGFNVGLSGKTKIKYRGDEQENKLKIGGKVGVEGRLGIHILLHSFLITGSYNLPLNKKQEEFFGENAYFELSIGFGLTND